MTVLTAICSLDRLKLSALLLRKTLIGVPRLSHRRILKPGSGQQGRPMRLTAVLPAKQLIHQRTRPALAWIACQLNCLSVGPKLESG